jgi:hypothetical protein
MKHGPSVSNSWQPTTYPVPLTPYGGFAEQSATIRSVTPENLTGG